MIVDRETADSLKVAAQRLFETPDGMVLIELLEELGGKYKPTYNQENATTITLEAGKRQILSTLYNLNRLTSEQIVEVYRTEG